MKLYLFFQNHHRDSEAYESFEIQANPHGKMEIHRIGFMSLRTLGHSTPEQYSKSTSLVLQQSLCIQLHWPASPLEPGSYLSVSDSKQFVCFLAVFKVCCALESPGDVPGLGPAGILVYGFCFMVWTGADSLFGSFVLQYWGLSLGHCTSYATTPLS